MNVKCTIELKKLKVAQACVLFDLSEDQVKRLREDKQVQVSAESGTKLIQSNCAVQIKPKKTVENEESE